MTILWSARSRLRQYLHSSLAPGLLFSARFWCSFAVKNNKKPDTHHRGSFSVVIVIRGFWVLKETSEILPWKLSLKAFGWNAICEMDSLANHWKMVLINFSFLFSFSSSFQFLSRRDFSKPPSTCTQTFLLFLSPYPSSYIHSVQILSNENGFETFSCFPIFQHRKVFSVLGFEWKFFNTN